MGWDKGQIISSGSGLGAAEVCVVDTMLF